MAAQRLDVRMKQFVLVKVRNHSLVSIELIPNTYGSSICEQLLKNSEGAGEFSIYWFTVLFQSHSLFHLNVLE